ncbi:HAUS augmin-like complex subunit 6 [Elgaria multicarinata webbii]|uniref:HAUS augmin-like complex subunit 6 n=1 Tax=Elgaria multicarinata webbii TaxID=159646 RepID=UPI002FCD4EA4
MSAQRPPPAWEKEHLWLYLLALDFDPTGAAAAGKISTHLLLGVNMFDKPNKDAFHIVAWFLFSKLDPSRCNEIFRFCFPPTDKKADSEFRKQCYEWLRRISDECGNNFPPVVASVFLSPGGPKFIHLMFHFGRYVMMHQIKADSSGADIPSPKAMNSRSPDLNMVAAKYRVAQNRFLQNLQKEDLLIQELQKKAQFFSKRIRDLTFENANLDKQLQNLGRMGKNVNNSQSNTIEKIEKVRCLWALVMETLKLLQKEREVVDSVVKGHVDQYVLDGTSVAVSVPRPLLEKVEKEIHKLHVGNVYEAGKLNILTIIHLLNNALEMLMHERRHIDRNVLKLDLQYLEEKTKFQKETLLGLKSVRQKLKSEDHVSISQSIAEKQQEWDLKWENYLGQSPFHLIKDPNPALDLLPAMSPISFTPATEETYKNSVFCQYPASILDFTKKNLKTNKFERTGKVSGSQNSSTVVVAERIVMSSSDLATESVNRIISEQRSKAETPKRTIEQSFPNLKYKGRNSRLVETEKKRQADTLRTPSSVKREDPLKKAQEQLAEEVADVVVSNSPQNTGGKGNHLDDLIGTLISDPFLARKQIPRTPENLITEIRSSWKNAIQVEESSSAELHHTEASKDVPQDTVPAFRNQIDLSMACFMSSCNSDTAESPLLEVPSPCHYQQAVISPSGLPTHQTAVGPLDYPFCKEGLTNTVPDISVAVHPELNLTTINNRVSELDHGPGDSIAAEALSPYAGQNSSMRTTLSWDASQMVSGISTDSHEVIQLGILQETFPEEAGAISLDSSIGLEPDEIREENSTDSKALPGYMAGNERKLDLQSIRSRYEALKKTLLENSSSRKQIPRCRSEFSLTPVSLESNDVLSPLGKRYALDAELVQPPSHMTLLERKTPVSPLVAFSPIQVRGRSGVQDRGDIFKKLNEK